MAEIEYPKKRPLRTEFQSLLRRTWLWLTAEKPVWRLGDGTYPKPTPRELAEDASYQRHSTIKSPRAGAGEAAGSADLPTILRELGTGGAPREQNPFLLPSLVRLSSAIS